MRILQLIASTGFYGAEQVVSLLSAQLVQLGCDVTIGLFNASTMPGHGLPQAAGRHGIPLWDFACSGRLDPPAVLRLARFLEHQRIDVLHTHGYKANLYGLPAARLAGCRVVATCHNWTDHTPALRRYGQLDRFLLRGFDRIIAVSDTVALRLEQSGVPLADMQVIPNGVDTARYRAAVLAHQPAPGAPPVLGAVSRLSPEKGIDVLLRALPRILAAYPGLQCVVMGEGPERARLKAQAASLGVSQNLALGGFCADIPAFLAGCLVVAHPSRIDGMPLAVLEAMSAGRPLVASAVGSIPELLQQGLAGLLVPSDDPEALAAGVLRLLGDTVLREELSRQAASRAQARFSALTMARHYVQTYRELSGAAFALQASQEMAQGV